MKENKLPLKELSIGQLYLESKECLTYQVPIYQRNYAWTELEISALVKDAYDSFLKEPDSVYYIGTLVTYKRDENIFEVIDGQQRLTTIYLILRALDIMPKNKLTFNARNVSKDTIEKLPNFPEVYDKGIKNGFACAKRALDVVEGEHKNNFINYLKNKVHIIHYNVPKDVDLNHYFEVMNSRGEQLEKHEIVKSELSANLAGYDLETFSSVWDACSDMNRYIQQKYPDKELFGDDLSVLNNKDVFVPNVAKPFHNKQSIKNLLSMPVKNKIDLTEKEKEDKFQAIIDFPNFLLVVLKLTLSLKDDGFNPEDFILDDKELIDEFKKLKNTKENAMLFANNLIRAKYFLDNYIVHHINDDKERASENPWELERYHKDSNNQHPKNLSSDDDVQHELVHLLSMFEVTFTAKQRKNYLFYCLLYLFTHDHTNIEEYLAFVRTLAEKMFCDVYLEKANLNDSNNLPKPNTFDKEILCGGKLNLEIKNKNPDFNAIYQGGSENIPLFIFNYADYKIWMRYAEEVRGKTKEAGFKKIKEDFFDSLGCADFGLKIFDDFYFSRTRKSLEHYYPRAKVNSEKFLTMEDINCFGNFAMISADANSSGSNWDPKTKLDHYLDKKTDPVGVASLKFKIMMQMCKDNGSSRDEGLEWNKEDMQNHQDKMMKILFS